MKRISTLLAVVLTAAIALQAQVQYPINGGAENWTTGTALGLTYDSLINWDTPQRLAVALAPTDTVTFKTDIAHSGALAVLMITKLVNIGGIITTEIPGSMSTGTFVVDLFTQEFGVEGGMNIDCKPDEMSGFYQYMPSGLDTGNIVLYMFDASGDTIADASLEFPDATTGGYTAFNMPITYTGTTDPAVVQILITSSGVGGQDGSTLYMDELVLSGNDCFTGLFTDGPRAERIDLVPNPAVNSVRFELPGTSALPAIMTDLQGRTVQSFVAQPGLNTMDLSGLSTGFYLIQISDNGVPVYAGKLEKH